jgi:hypothetical protein
MSNVLPGHKHVEHFSISIIIEKMHIFGKYTIKTRQYCNFILTYSIMRFVYFNRHDILAENVLRKINKHKIVAMDDAH